MPSLQCQVSPTK